MAFHDPPSYNMVMMRSFTCFCLALILSLPALAAGPKRIVALGDSLTAGYGLAPAQAYPAQLQVALQKQGYDVHIDNAGVSGNTAAEGLARIDAALAGPVKPDLVIIALGANDMLRGFNPAETERNLRAILQRLKTDHTPAILYGVRTPYPVPGFGTAAFDAMYGRLADDFDVPLYPSFLKGVSLNPKYTLDDGLHPNAAGVGVMVDNTLPEIEDALNGKHPNFFMRLFR